MTEKRKKLLKYAKPSKETTIRMRLVKSFGTRLEVSMAKMLRKEGIRFRRQPRLPGRPDFRLVDAKIVAFCDSSFWHGRHAKDVNGKSFKKNRAFWVQKLSANRARDLKTNRLLRALGWRVLRFWDTDIFHSPNRVVTRLRAEVKACQ